MALFIVERVGTGFSVRSGENTLQAAASALTAAAWAEGTLPGGAGTKSAKEWAGEAAQSAAYAGGFETPEYASQAAGEAATTPGQIFRVPLGTTPQTFNWYRRLVSGSEVVSPLATAAYLSSIVSGDQIRRPSAPTVADAGAAGNVNGTVHYAITYLTAGGGETEAGSRVSITVTNRQVQLSNIPVSANSRVIGRRIYRTPAGAADPVLGQLLATINDNTTTTFLDNVADGSLGAAAPWINTTGATLLSNGTRFASASDQSTVFGQGAMPNSTGGYANTAFGGYALAANATGYRNTGFGLYALTAVTTGNANTAMGVHAGEASTTGSGNVTMGYAAFDQNPLGNENVTIGNFANRQTAGSRTVFVGFGAGQLRASGDDNVGLGYFALRGGATSTGTGNVAVGRSAGSAITTANFNALFGHLAGTAITTGSTNVIFGANAGTSVTTGANNLFFGAFAGNRVTTENNRLFIDTINRANIADAENLGLLNGVFGAGRANQLLRINGLLYANVGVALPRRAVTGDATLTVEDHTVIVTGTATVTLTLPNAANFPGKIYHIVNRAAFTVVSNTSNVIPIAGGAAGTAILPATAGAWAQLQSNGSTWDIIAS